MLAVAILALSVLAVAMYLWRVDKLGDSDEDLKMALKKTAKKAAARTSTQATVNVTPVPPPPKLPRMDPPAPKPEPKAKPSPVPEAAMTPHEKVTLLLDQAACECSKMHRDSEGFKRLAEAAFKKYV